MKTKLSSVLKNDALLALVVLTWWVTTLGDCLPSPTGLIAWWPGEESLEDIASANDGTSDTPAAYSEGIIGKAIACGWEDWAVVPDSPTLRPRSFTIEGWFRFASPQYMTLISKGLGSGSDKSFSIRFLPNYPCLSAGVNRFYPNRSAECPFAPELGRWYHIAFPFDDASDQMALYVDGALAATVTCAPSIQYDDNLLIIGAEINAGQVTSQFHGSIDELTSYNRALSPEEIHAIWQAGSLGRCKASLKPRILAQPQSWRVPVGEARLDFSVAA